MGKEVISMARIGVLEAHRMHVTEHSLRLSPAADTDPFCESTQNLHTQEPKPGAHLKERFVEENRETTSRTFFFSFKDFLFI